MNAHLDRILIKFSRQALLQRRGVPVTAAILFAAPPKLEHLLDPDSS